MGSLIHLVKRSGSLSMIDHRRLRPVDDMVLFLSCVVGESGSVKLDARRLLVNVRPILDSNSVLCSCNLTPDFLPVSLM